MHLPFLGGPGVGELRGRAREGDSSPKQWEKFVSKFFRFMIKVFYCHLFDYPKTPKLLKQGTYGGRGDYADEWGRCERCGGLTHRDMHIFGDGVWRHADEY